MIRISLDKGTVAHHTIRVRQYHHQVVCLIDGKPVVMNTPAAVKAGVALATMAGQAQRGEIITMTHNGETIKLLPYHAKKIGGALLKKADLADDFQRKIA